MPHALQMPFSQHGTARLGLQARLGDENSSYIPLPRTLAPPFLALFLAWCIPSIDVRHSAPHTRAMLKLLSTLFASAVLLQAAEVIIPSPSGSTQLALNTDPGGNLVYKVQQGGIVRFEPARVGVLMDSADLGAGVTLGVVRTNSLSEVFDWRGGKAFGTNRCTAAEISIRSGSGQDWVFEVRVFDEGAGFRYRIPGVGSRLIKGETTRWRLPRTAKVWFQTNTSDYEGDYQVAAADKVPLTQGDQKAPVHLGPPITICFDDGMVGMVSEAALFKYSGMTLRPEGDAVFHAVFQDDPNGWQHEGECLSPWRVMILVKDLNALVNCDVIPALCDPPDATLFPQGPKTAWLRPGKAPCTWMIYGNDGAQWDKQKWFVDVCAAMGCEYLLVDAGWRTEKWGWLKNGGNLWARAAELCRYAAERNVGILLWHAYPEGRDDGPGLTTVEAREELFTRCREAGVKGIKIDFFNSESRKVIDAYEDLLRRSARHQLMINFHGANKPTGEARTWPNEMTREGIREQEYVLWGTLPLAHYGALPFTRMAAGHGDFLPGYVQRRFLKNTTAMFQMASVITHTTPMLCWPDNPEAYLDSPLLQFVREVPVVWDETRVLAGTAIGDTVVIARRHAASWYLALLNCRPEKQDVSLDLAFTSLSGKELTLWQDGDSVASVRIESAVPAPADGKLCLSLRPSGGAVLRVAAQKEHAGWR